MVNIFRKASVPAAALVFILVLSQQLPAEGDLSMEFSLSNIILQTRESIADTAVSPATYTAGDSYWGWTTTGSAGFSFKSVGNRNVKADLSFSFILPETDLGTYLGAPGALATPLISIDRAWIKARFPEFRITAGKTRLDWGDGFVFNSGDVIFGSTDILVDLTAAEVRTDTEWLTALNIPLGRFSFIEAVILPPASETPAGLSIGKLSETSAGGRFYTNIEGIKAEGGYYFDNSASDLHKIYLGLQGNLLADWYLSSSVALPVSGNIEETARSSFNLSGGLFYLLSLNSVSSMTFRIEALCRPFGTWSETVPESGGNDPEYAFFLYPEINWAPTDTVNLSVRSIFSPVDLSALITAGASWNVFEGFDLSLHAALDAGDSDDIFAWEKADELWVPGTDVFDGAAVIIGIKYIY